MVRSSPFPSYNSGHQLILPRYFYERSMNENCEPFFQLAQKICELEDEESCVDLLSEIYYSRGADASEVNDPARCWRETSNFYQLRLKHSKISPQGRKDLRLGMAYNQMGVAHMMLKEYESAVTMLEESFLIYKSLDNSMPILATLPAANMGLAYWYLGKYEDAYKVLIDILREREAAFGVNDDESFKFVLYAPGTGP